MSKSTIQSNTNKWRFVLGIFVVMAILPLNSCKKWLEVPAPVGSLTEEDVYSTDAAAIAVLNGIYTSISQTDLFQGPKGISLIAGLSADELTLYNGVTDVKHQSYYQNQLAATSLFEAGSEYWSLLYPFVYRCNAAIEGVGASDNLNPIVKQQLLGEARLLRAIFYLYLVNFFGDLPLPTTTDPQENTLLSRASRMNVYEQIIADLNIAKELLSENYLDETLFASTTERVRPTRGAAYALLSRAYLYAGEYAKAEEHATFVINSTNLYALVSINDVFLKNSSEAIWQIQPTTAGMNTAEGQTFIIPETGPSDVTTFPANPVYLSHFLLNSFEPGDQRGVYGNWVDTTIYMVTETEVDTVAFPYKYKMSTSPDVSDPGGMTEYLMMLRLGEQYLIRGEARAQQDNISGAREDLLQIRRRAGLDDATLTANDKASLLATILHERQVELFTEFGHRWFDLKRTGLIDAVMNIVTPQKANGAMWQSYQQWYPVPFIELGKSPNLIQTPGY